VKDLGRCNLELYQIEHSILYRKKIEKFALDQYESNIIVGIQQIAITLPIILDYTNYHLMFASSVEAVLLALVIWSAWKWPTQKQGERYVIKYVE